MLGIIFLILVACVALMVKAHQSRVRALFGSDDSFIQTSLHVIRWFNGWTVRSTWMFTGLVDGIILWLFVCSVSYIIWWFV